MKDKEKRIKVAITMFLTLSSVSATLAAHAVPDQNTEKCYGIAKAGMNDCATAKQSCAGSATKNNQPDAFIFLPKGLCDRIVGGHLQTIEETKA